MGPLPDDLTASRQTARRAAVTTIPISQLRYSSATWPRVAVNSGRVEMFVALLADGEVVPSIEVVANGDGTFWISDGVHRTEAALQCGRDQIEAVVVMTNPDESVVNCAYRRALETATNNALPLGKLERRRPVNHLLEIRPDLSRREIARWVGVVHSSVDHWASEADHSATGVGRATPILGPTASEVATKPVRCLGQLSDSRGLFDYIAPQRMGRHLADAFNERFGDRAWAEASQVASWLDRATAMLQGTVQ